VAGRTLLRLVAFQEIAKTSTGRWRQAGKDLPHPKENTMPPIAELSLEQIDSIFGLDNAPDIKSPLVLVMVARDKAAAEEFDRIDAGEGTETAA